MNQIVAELMFRRDALTSGKIPVAQFQLDWFGEETVYSTLKEEARVNLSVLHSELRDIDELLAAWDARPDHIVDVTDMVEGGGK